MKYRVINKRTKEDITDRYDWVVSPNGQLSYNDGGDLIGDPDAMYLPEAAMDEFYKSIKTLKSLNYYNNNSEIVADNKIKDKHGIGIYKCEEPEEFAKLYCSNCGSQRCEGIGTPWFEGCMHKECLKDYENYYG